MEPPPSKSRSPRNRLHLPTPDSELEVVVTDDGSRTLARASDGVTWHSESGALAESQLVFLNNSGVLQRLQANRPTRVLEIGFGTGLNFWTTASIALRSATRLNYLSLETKLLSPEVLYQLQHGSLEDCQPAFDRFFEKLVQRYHSSARQIRLNENNVQLTIQNLDATGFAIDEATFDAVYFDPFGPDDAPELWQEPLFHSLHGALVPRGRLVTYCVKSEIRRRLSTVGFEVEKTAGPVGGKREVLVATRKPDPA